MTDLTETVRDWATDFDILEPDYVVHPEHRWAEQREQCPIAFTERRQRTWLPVRYEDVAAIAHDVERFSSRDIAVVSPFGDMVGDDFFTAPPITSDPPVHTWARRLLLPAFGPSAVDRMTPITHVLAVCLIGAHCAGGSGAAAADYARHIPVRIIALMLGVPLEDEDRFTTWVVRILQEGFQHMDRAMDTLGEVIAYFVEKVAIRRAIPEGQRPDDLLTLLIESDEEGMTDEHLIGTCFLLLVAGIDTTWSAIGSGLWHLAAHPEDQARLRTEPELMPLAVEEILRVYSPVTMARHVVEDTEFAGCPMKAGDKILMAFPAGNRDPEMFDRADEFVIDRERNRHFAFGSGIHRCLGSNLARMELRVALETFLEHVPTFTLADPDAVTWTGGQVRGPRCVPISF
jgi:cytochrome P450